MAGKQWKSAAEAAGWLRARRQALGLTPSMLARRAQPFADEANYPVKFSQQLIWKFEKDAKKIPGWLPYVEAALQEAHDPDGFNKADIITQTQRPDDVIMVREVDISYAMGDGALIEDYPDTDVVPFKREFIRALTRTAVDNLFIAKGSGDSMMPTLINDDLVLVDTSRKRVTEQDRIWALVVNGAGMIKRVRRLPGDRYEIISDNPIIPPQTVDHDDLFIIGRVIWIGRRV